ncbi:hypothetical protein BLA29_014187 [Euroglyphus maynei]|uniref:Uncharacterized protein n=1 Tax=Euroglyphus maynei TaxID=6958 RepID=A0A1Y3B015_EURMA|nr:hypothetical protein BLA29_014187 [Euroglyphus maynei]
MNVLVKSGLTLNPFVYGFMSSNFRSMICSSFGGRHRNKRNKMSKNIPFHHSNYENNNRRI